jgi:hypothetical protein
MLLEGAPSAFAVAGLAEPTGNDNVVAFTKAA